MKKKRERKSFITEETKINIDEAVFKARAERLIAKQFVDYVNKLHQREVLELKQVPPPR